MHSTGRIQHRLGGLPEGHVRGLEGWPARAGRVLHADLVRRWSLQRGRGPLDPDADRVQGAREARLGRRDRAGPGRGREHASRRHCLFVRHAYFVCNIRDDVFAAGAACASAGGALVHVHAHLVVHAGADERDYLGGPAEHGGSGDDADPGHDFFSSDDHRGRHDHTSGPDGRGNRDNSSSRVNIGSCRCTSPSDDEFHNVVDDRGIDYLPVRDQPRDDEHLSDHPFKHSDPSQHQARPHPRLHHTAQHSRNCHGHSSHQPRQDHHDHADDLGVPG